MIQAGDIGLPSGDGEDVEQLSFRFRVNRQPGVFAWRIFLTPCP